jgi:hypothetical protein
MKISSGALALLVALGCATAVPAIAQDNDHRDQQAQQDQRRDQVGDQDRDHRDMQNHDQDRDRDNMQNRDDRNYISNKYYQQGWKDGQKHKHKNHKFKNDDDRKAYEAGFGHGDRGEPWQNQGHKRDKDDDHGGDHSHP